MAINKTERRFLRHWEEQRKGSRLGYYTLHILVWFFVSFLCLFFVLNNFIDIKQNKLYTLYIMIAASLAMSLTVTHFTYLSNEKKFKKIIQREVNENEET